MQLRPNTQYIVEPDGTVSRVGDDQPLYSWQDKVRAANESSLTATKTKIGLGSGILGMIGKQVVARVAAQIVRLLLGQW